jgi:hypothetical protein
VHWQAPVNTVMTDLSYFCLKVCPVSSPYDFVQIRIRNSYIRVTNWWHPTLYFGYLTMRPDWRQFTIYFRRNPGRRRRLWKGNPVPRGITGSPPPCHWGTYRDLVLQVDGWRQGSRPCSVKKKLLGNRKKWKPDGLIEDKGKVKKIKLSL